MGSHRLWRINGDNRMSIERAQQYGLAADQVEALIQEIYGVKVCKLSDLATTEGMETEARRVGRRLYEAAMPLESAAVSRGKSALAGYEPGQSAASLSALATSLTEQAKGSLPQVSAVLTKETPGLYQGSGKDLARSHKLDNKDHPMAEKAQSFLAKVDPMFISAAYDSKADSLASRWKEIVTSGGSVDTIRAALVGTLDYGLTWGSPESYWSIVATSFVNRIKSWVSALLFHSNAIKNYRWVSVMDGSTSMQCRFLHDRLFPVAAVMEKLTGLLEAEDLATVKKLQPFLQIGKRNEGRVIYYETGGETTIVASIGDEGSASPRFFSHLGESSELALIEAGIVFPPIHTWCRSTIIPER